MRKEDAAKLIAFIEARRPTSRPIITGNLPPLTSPSFQTIQIPRDKFARFRDRYAELSVFAAAFCGVPVETMCIADMERALWARSCAEDAARGWARIWKRRAKLGRKA
jgi:hypothetical protein